jgi:organic radical activating enzyme
LPYEDIDISKIKVVEELPVFSKGCDSSYTWAKKYKHLITDRTVEEAVDELTALLPTSTFKHTKTGQRADMVFTGGEPMLKQAQLSMVAIMREFAKRGDCPHRVTVETNGTKPIQEDLINLIDDMYISSEFGGLIPDARGNDIEWYWSVSPKLWTTAGEENKRAIKPEVVKQYANASDHGQLKFVVNGSKESWDEVEEHVKAFRDAGVSWPVWIMGVGGTVEGLKMTEAIIADEAIQRGYYYTSRVHAHIYGNAIGK